MRKRFLQIFFTLLVLAALGIDRASAAIAPPSTFSYADSHGYYQTFYSYYRDAYYYSQEFDRLAAQTREELGKADAADRDLIDRNIREMPGAHKSMIEAHDSAIAELVKRGDQELTDAINADFNKTLQANALTLAQLKHDQGVLNGLSPEQLSELDRDLGINQLTENVKHPEPDPLPGLETASETCDFSVWGGTNWGTCLKVWVSWVFALVLWLFTRILWLANELFNQAINVSVRTFSNYANSAAVQTSWGAIRDLVNMGFIFALLYIAIGTILELQAIDWKKLVPKLIIVALLVNFSAFFTRVVIDVSNIAANQFYLSAAVGDTAGGAPDITTALMKGVDIFRTTMASEPKDFAGPSIGGKVIANPGGLDWSKIVTGFLGGIVLALVASFVFLAGTVLFVVRTIRLLFLIILSPLAFFFIILPKTEGYWKKWLSVLISDAVFAPAFLIMIYMVTTIAQKLGAAGGAGSGWVGETIYFMLIIGLLLGAIIVAKNLGAAGAGAAMKFGSWGNAAMVGAGMGLARLGGRFVGKGASSAASAIDKRYGEKSELLRAGKWAGKGISSTLKQVDKISPSVALARRKISEGIASPLRTSTDLLSKVTRDYGITSSILGSTKDEERALRKIEKEDREALDADKLRREKEEVGNLKIGNTPEERRAAKEKVQNIGSKTIVKIDPDSLIRLATLLTDQQMTSLEKELDSDKFAKIKTTREKPFNEALGYDEEGKQTKTVNKDKIREELGKMSHQTVAKLPEEKLKKLEVIENLIEEDIKEMRKTGVSTETIDHITKQIKTMGSTHPAYDYATKSPARGIPIRGMGRQQVPAIVTTRTNPPTTP